MRTLLIDADSECYAAAAAAETRRYIGWQEQERREAAMGLDSGIVWNTAGKFLGPFNSKKELTAAIPEGEAVVPFQSKEVHTEESACLLLDARLRRIVYQAQEKYGEVRPEVYVSGKLNFRHMIDPSYKGNRDGIERPHWLQRLKDHAVHHWRARVTRTWEADDELGMRATELGLDNYIICSLDKDLLQIPGRHIIIGKGHLDVTERGAMLRLYRQILSGDATDNIRGCWQMGDKGAFEYLEPFVDAGPRALWAAVVAKYQASLDKYGADKCRYIDARGAALHTAQLVYIQRERPEGPMPARWTPPEEI
jgi:hypothetical protein